MLNRSAACRKGLQQLKDEVKDLELESQQVRRICATEVGVCWELTSTMWTAIVFFMRRISPFIRHFKLRNHASMVELWHRSNAKFMF